MLWVIVNICHSDIVSGWIKSIMNVELDEMLRTYVGLQDLSSILELSTKLYIKYPWNVLSI